MVSWEKEYLIRSSESLWQRCLCHLKSLSPWSSMTRGAGVSVGQQCWCVCVCLCREMWHLAASIPPPLAHTDLSFPISSLQQKEKKNKWGGCRTSRDQKWLLPTKEEAGQLSPCQAPPAALPSLPACTMQPFTMRASCCCGLRAGAGHSLSTWISILPLQEQV